MTTSRSYPCSKFFFVSRATARALAALAVIASAHGAERAKREDRETPVFKVTTIPAADGNGRTLQVETRGAVSNRYMAFDTADDTTFDLTRAHIAGSPEHPMRNPVTIGEQERPPKNIRILGGVVNGGIPHEWRWFLSHAFGGAGFYTVATGLQVIDGARIHNVEDGWHPRETPSFKLRAYPNTGRFMMRNCYMTGIRDDCIENDEFIPGDIEDSLFDGVWTLLSEQNERQAGLFRPNVTTIGPSEDRNINLTRVLVRLTMTNANEQGPGKWFKLMGRESPVHRITITDCVFATDAEPRQGGWRSLGFPQDATFHGTNYVLWLGRPGAFGVPIPPQVKFLEGQAAKDKWHEVRNRWLEAHGYERRSPDDWDPMKAPVAAPRPQKAK
jgi:hypothetical protein